MKVRKGVCGEFIARMGPKMNYWCLHYQAKTRIQMRAHRCRIGQLNRKN